MTVVCVCSPLYSIDFHWGALEVAWGVLLTPWTLDYCTYGYGCILLFLVIDPVRRARVGKSYSFVSLEILTLHKQNSVNI